MTEQNQTNQNWIEQEKNELGAQSEGVFDKLPSLKLKENEITEIEIDLSEKFRVYETTNLKNQPITKAIMPVMYKGERHNWWLNKRNPIYREILDLGAGKAKLTIKVMQTGTKQNTKYIIVK